MQILFCESSVLKLYYLLYFSRLFIAHFIVTFFQVNLDEIKYICMNL